MKAHSKTRVSQSHVVFSMAQRGRSYKTALRQDHVVFNVAQLGGSHENIGDPGSRCV
jgi:hypothetical protein